MSKKTTDKTHRELWSTFTDNTTIHGFPHVKKSSGVCKSIFWLLVSLAAFGFLIVHLHRIFSTYFAYNTSVKLSILQQYKTDFPTVTMCNLNPIKQSSLGLDATLESLLSDGGVKKKRRRKRATEPSCSGASGATFAKYGICYTWLGTNKYSQTTGSSGCRHNYAGGMYMPVNQEIADFVATSGILDSAPSDKYWIYYKRLKWAELIEASWTNFNPNHRDDTLNAAYIDINDNNQWHSVDNSEPHTILCQRVIECPHPVYTDAFGMTFCWFTPLGSTVATFEDGSKFCQKFSYEANSLFEPRTEAAMSFFLGSLLYSSIPSDAKYWIGYKHGDWLSGENVQWSNWDQYGDIYDAAYIDKGLGTNEWHSVDNNDPDEQAMVICQIQGLAYNGFVWSTTASSETTKSITTEEISTTEETTLQSFTTEGKIEIEPSTTEEETIPEQSTTTEQTTHKQATTKEQTTHEQSTTVEQTTLKQPTTGEQTTHEQSTKVEQTTPEQSSTVEQTKHEQSTTVEQTSRDQSTTLNKTTFQQSTTIEERTPAQSPTMVTTSTEYSTSTIEVKTSVNRKPLQEDFILEQTIVEHLASVPDTVKEQMGYQAYEFVVDCQYEGWNCDTDMLYRYFNPVYGNCYLFNSGWNSSLSVETAQRTGRMYGLKVILNIGEDEYLHDVGGPAGARIIVHPQSSMPHPENEGNLAEPGKLISIGVKRVVVNRKGPPYGNCTDSSKHDNLDVYAEHFPVTYDKQNCFRTCYQRNVIERCGCADPFVPRSGSSLGIQGEARVCDVTDQEEDDCRYVVNFQYTNGDLGCSNICPDPCFEEYFVSSTSTAVWPSTYQKDSILEKIKDKTPQIYSSNDTEKYKRNLLMLEVFYEDFNYEEIEELETYKTEQFYSDVGGILGLWVGCSVISLFELLELGMDFVGLALSKLFCLKKVKPTETFGEQTNTMKKHHPRQLLVMPAPDP